MTESAPSSAVPWVTAAPRNVNVRQPSVLVLHTTWCTLEEAFARYQQGPVSAHYTVDRNGDVYQHVDELAAAHHAGVSYWHRASVNQASLGVEIVNGVPEGACATLYGGAVLPACASQLRWEPLAESQIESVLALCAELLRRYPIDPFDVVGHADVAPLRKEDPGPAFPWLRLARAGIGVAYDAVQGALVHGDEEFAVRALPAEGADGRLARAQQQLAALGYDVPSHGACDHATERVLLAFNAHYLGRFDAELSDETAAVIDGLWRWRTDRQTRRLALAVPLAQ